MRTVYTWPPVGILSSKWTIRAPVGRSRSLVDGSGYMSAQRRMRYAASVRVGGRSFDYTGHGYMEALKYMLNGGVNLVRLEEWVEPYQNGMSTQIGDEFRAMSWRSAGQPLTWTRAGGTTFAWSAGEMILGTVANPSTPRFIQVAGQTPGKVLIRPGQRVLAIKGLNGTPVEALVTRPAIVNRNGVAQIKVLDPPGTDTTHVVLRYRQSRIFEVDGKLPEVMVDVNQEPVWEWNFVQVHDEEIPPPITEVNPW